MFGGGGSFPTDIFQSSFKPLEYNTQLLTPTLFDFIDYNPLRNLK